MTKKDLQDYAYTTKILGLFLGIAIMAVLFVPVFLLMALFNLVFK